MGVPIGLISEAKFDFNLADIASTSALYIEIEL
jgi:hypothetical protein